MMRSKNPKFHLRYRLVMTALAEGIRAAARSFRCSGNTVHKWVRRYQEQGLAGLEERSRAPQRILRKTPPDEEQQVLAARDAAPCFGPRRLKRYFRLGYSTGAIARILR